MTKELARSKHWRGLGTDTKRKNLPERNTGEVSKAQQKYLPQVKTSQIGDLNKYTEELDRSKNFSRQRTA